MRALALAIGLATTPTTALAVPIMSIPKLINMGLRNTAKEFCSCYFITGGSEESCADYARINQFKVHFKVYKETQTIQSRAILDVWPMPSAKANFSPEAESCFLQND